MYLCIYKTSFREVLSAISLLRNLYALFLLSFIVTQWERHYFFPSFICRETLERLSGALRVNQLLSGGDESHTSSDSKAPVPTQSNTMQDVLNLMYSLFYEKLCIC